MNFGLYILLLLTIKITFAQSLFNKIVNSPIFILDVSGTSADGLYKPRDLDFHTDSSKANELWVINENSAIFDPNFGGSTVTFYNSGSDSQWADYRKDSYSAHFMNTASGIAFSDNGGFANTLDVQDANGNQNGYFSGCTLWEADTAIYARINQNGPELGSHWDMLHQSPFSVGIAAERDNIYWLFDGFHNTIAKYNFQDPHPDHEHGGEDHSDGIIYRYDEVIVDRVAGLSSHMVVDSLNDMLYICDTGNQRVIRIHINSGEIGSILDPYGENIEGYYSMINADFETVIDSGLALPTGIDIYNTFLLVSDYSTGEIFIYDLQVPNQFQLIHTLETGIIEDLMSIKVGPDGTIWFVSTNANKLYQILPPINGDFDGDNSISLNDFIVLLSHILNTNSIIDENLFLADLNYDSVVDLLDLILLIDLID